MQDHMDCKKTITELSTKRQKALQSLIEPARAAAAALKDAGLCSTADRLGTVLFELDAVDQAMQEAIAANPFGMLDVLLASVRRSE